MARKFSVMVAAILLLAGRAVSAETALSTMPAAMSSGAFQSLPPADRKLAHALFEAQQPTADGAAPLNLDQIAALRAERPWVKVFELMQGQGLLNAKTLGQVVALNEHRSRHETASSAVVVATGSGRIHTIATASTRASRQD